MKMNDTGHEDLTLLSTCTKFLNSIGIPTLFKKIDGGSFLPGLQIEHGSIVIDMDALRYPGDVLHEAGHIAVVPAADRLSLDQQAIIDSKNRDSEEMMAIAWSYAACVHLAIDPHLVFHESGYKGGGRNIVENFRAGRFMGTPMLHWCKMTIEPGAARSGEEVYPKMIKWLRE